MPSGNAIDTDMSTATDTNAMVCMEAIQRPEIRQYPNITAANTATRTRTISATAIATMAITAKGGNASSAPSMACKLTSTATLIDLETTCRLVLNQSTNGAMYLPGEN
ncbi:hypothetical protein D3C72_1984730 [compost metagenome]